MMASGSITARCEGNCKGQSPANLIPNGGFDTGVGEWIAWGTDGPATWSPSDDASACTTSGALKGGAYSPCVTVPGSTTFIFGAALNPAGASGGTSCGVRFYPPGCMGRPADIPTVVMSDVPGWQHKSVEISTGGNDVFYIRVECHGGLADEIYLTRAF